MADVCVKFNELSEAEKCGQRALEVAQVIPDKIKALDILGNVYAETARKRRAIECYQSELNHMEEIGSPDAARVKNQIEAWRREMETTCEFETVTVDASGQVKQRRKVEARQFTEELASGVTLEMVEIPGGTFTMVRRRRNKIVPMTSGPSTK